MMKLAARPLLAISLLAISLGTSATRLDAQTHRVERPETVTRAVAVYEYLGDLRKPTAARLIPVSLFLGGHFEDAGTYLSQPMPLALQTGTAYELQNSGTRVGMLDLAYAKNFRQNTAETTSNYDDGWFGYGTFRAPKSPKTPVLTAKNNGKSTGHAYEVQDDGKPHFGSKSDADPSDKKQRAPDPDPADTERATRISLPEDSRDPKAPDPDRPTLKRSSTDQNGGPKQKRDKPVASVSQTPPDPNSDPDRPTIKRRGSSTGDSNSGVPPDPSELNSRKSTHGTGGTVSGAEPTLTDANRPELKRGKPAVLAANAPDLAKVSVRVPGNELKQTVAISDAKDRAEHDFTHHFESDAERATAMHDMEALALAVLANPALATDADDFKKQAAAVADTAAKSATTRMASRTAPRAARRSTTARNRSAAASTTTAGATASPAATDRLAQEQLSALQLSFGAPITYVFTAHTPDGTTPIRYVTVVAQKDLDGKLQTALRTTTDSAHLDRTPRYRFVDAVDADASNRASLLFELRNQSSRQFALYRLLGSRPDQVFETGSTR